MRQKIAVVGSGIAGLGAAWALQRAHDVTLFESDERPGGHANTTDVLLPEGPVAVDTGFIVYNEVTYPNLTRLFAELRVPTEPSSMSFAFSLDRRFEYGASLKGVLASPANLMSRRFRRMMLDIDRFRRIGSELAPEDGESIDELLRKEGFSEGFVEDYLYPMAGAIWSARQEEIRRFPARSILRFLSNHGLIRIAGRPAWRTVSGGSREYVHRLLDSFDGNVRLGAPVDRVLRQHGRVDLEGSWGNESYDQVVLATHSDQTLRMLGTDATPEEASALGAIRYEPNLAVLHGDVELMPRRRAVWSSWNAMASSSRRAMRAASVSYWMNRLQNLETTAPLFVSLNPMRLPDPRLTYASFEYAHPQFDGDAIDAQRSIARIQGLRNTWFAGAYLGYGFHEDGLQSGLNVAAALGSPAPWHGTFEPVSSALEPALAAVPR